MRLLEDPALTLEIAQERYSSTQTDLSYLQIFPTPWKKDDRTFLILSSRHLHSHLPADTFIQKTKKLYLDTRTQRNMAMLNDDLSEVSALW